jgi:hypothetical protein
VTFHRRLKEENFKHHFILDRYLDHHHPTCFQIAIFSSVSDAKDDVCYKFISFQFPLFLFRWKNSLISKKINYKNIK